MILVIVLLTIVCIMIILLNKEKYQTLPFKCNTNCPYACTNFAPMYGFNGSNQLFDCENACNQYVSGKSAASPCE
jgi:hypothetical protein